MPSLEYAPLELPPPEPVVAEPEPKRKTKPRKAASVVEQKPLSPRIKHYQKLKNRWRQSLKAQTITIAQPPVDIAPPSEVDIKALPTGLTAIKRIVEAILFAAKEPLSAKQIQQIFPELKQPTLKDIQQVLNTLSHDYQSRPIELKQVASGFRFQVRNELSPWVGRLFEEKPAKYSRALLETLSIIAYRQPVTRGDIEDIRGVSVSSTIIQTLMEREWIKVIGHKDVPGRPSLLGTTQQFLDYFNLTSLNELPTLQALKTGAVNLSISEVENHEQP